VLCEDMLTSEQFEVSSRTFVNATGAFCDALRKCVLAAILTALSDAPASRASKDALPLITPSSGVHITLPAYFCPDSHGLIIPKTKDGRVVFLLPWLGKTIAGTTDALTNLTELPCPTLAEVDFILDALSDYLVLQPRRSDVLSAWSGIRPLAADASKGSTENITRDHVLTVDAGLVTITGGKVRPDCSSVLVCSRLCHFQWTTYRKVPSPSERRACFAVPHSCAADGRGYDRLRSTHR